MRRLAVLLVLSVLATPALGQPVPRAADSVTVTEERSRAAIERYLGSVATATVIAGKIARWERHAICPVVAGLRPEFLSFITARIRQVAQEVGAPVNAAPDCTPNIRIVFTTTPQALLDNVRKHYWGMLGYARTNRDADRLAIVTHPIQGWYATETLDWKGRPRRDALRVICLEKLIMDCPIVYEASPFKTANGQKSQFEHVTIVADPTKLGDPEMGVLADLIAMLALSQPQPSEDCRGSVLDMVAGCAPPPSGFSAMDMSYLRSLYHMRGLAVGTRNPIAARMEKDLAGQ